MEKAVSSFGGNRDGKPLFRLVWGGNHISLDGEIPYTLNRWHLEKYHQGKYEHVYGFGQCTHMRPGQTQWCKKCFLSGGEYLDISTHYIIVERAMKLLLMCEGLQNSALQKNALMEREKKQAEETSENIVSRLAEKEPRSVKRSKSVNLKRRIRQSEFVPGFQQIN